MGVAGRISTMACFMLFVILVCHHFACTAQYEGDFTASGSSVAQTSRSRSTDQAFSTKEDNITITVLGLFPYHFTGATLEALYQGDFAFGIVARVAAQMALDDIKKTDDLLSGHNLELKSVDSECDVGSCLYSVAEEALRPNRPVIILGPHCNKPTEYVGEFVTVNSNVITVSYGSNTPELIDSEKYRGFFRTVPPKTELNKGVHTLLNRFRWERICLAVQGDNFNIKLSESLIQYLEEKSFNFTIIHSVTERDIQFLSGSFCRVFIIIADPVNYPYVVCFLKLSGLTGAAYQTIFMGQFGTSEINFWNTFCPPDNLILKGSQSSISAYFSIENEKEEEKEELEEDNWKKNILHGADFEAKLSACLEELARDIEYDFNASIVIENSDLVIAGAAYDAMWLIALGINASIEPLAENGWTLEDYLPQSHAQVSQLIIDNFENVSFEGVYKKIDFTKQRHHPNVDVFISQFQGDAFVPIAIYSSDSDNVTWDNNSSFIWIGDKPPKDRPSVVNVTIPTWVGIFMMVLTLLGLILSGIFFSFNCYFRNQRLIKASSPHINNLIILGCVVGFLSITSFTLEGYYGIPESTRTYFCNSSVLMVCSAFTLSFGALLVKTWRIYMIFRNPWAKHRIYKDYVLYIIVAVMLGVDTLIFCFLLGFGPLKSVEDKMFTTEYTYAFQVCEGQNFNGVFVGILVIYKLLMLVFGVFLAIQSHKIKSKAFNDSKYIAMAIYGVVLIILIGLPIAIFAFFGNQLLWSFIAINVTVATCCSIILFTVFIPKVVILYKRRNETNATLVTSKYNTEVSTNTSHQHTNTRFRKMSYDVAAHRRTQNIPVRRTKSDAFLNTTSSVVFSPSLPLLSFEETTSTEQTSVLGNERSSLTPDLWPPTMEIIAEEIESDDDSTSV